MNKQTFHVHIFHAKRGCLSYLLEDTYSQEAILIDPSQELFQEYLSFFKEHSTIKLCYILETHTHADHISIAKELRQAHNAKIGMSVHSPSPSKDIALKDGDEIVFGESRLIVWETPGHTNESVVFISDGLIFSGDTLLIGGTGRTDFQLGSSDALYDSLSRILTLPDATILYPGHNYHHKTSSTLAEEKTENTRLTLVSQGRHDEFVARMNEHHPPQPELFMSSLKQNSL